MNKKTDGDRVDFASLYDNHEEYRARRLQGSAESRQIEIEVQGFKIPNLIRLLPDGYIPQNVLEIGCATGELIASFPVLEGGRRFGCDISEENVAAASARFTGVSFYRGGIECAPPVKVDCVVLSDILEHVEDDAEFLKGAAKLSSRYVLVNLPLEDNWTNYGRKYGPEDASGHLRKYTLREGLELLNAPAECTVVTWHQAWVHEWPAHEQRKRLREELTGHRYGGSVPTRVAKAFVEWMALHIPPFGRRLHPSNLFALLRVTPVVG